MKQVAGKRVSGCWLREAGCRFPLAGREIKEIKDTQFLKETGFRNPISGSWFAGSGCRKQISVIRLQIAVSR